MDTHAPDRWQQPIDHQFSTLFQRPDRLQPRLEVITPIYNPRRWRSRWKLYEDFAKRVHNAGARLWTVEVAFGERDFAITSENHPQHIRLRTRYELWLKERLINLGVGVVSRYVPDWSAVAWVDADMLFARSDWANETLHQLQHHAFVQMWSQYQDLTSRYEVTGAPCDSFAHRHVTGKPQPAIVNGKSDGYGYPGGVGDPKRYPGAPGLAWAATRAGWDAVGGLLDCCILGAGDWYMAHALVGRLDAISMRSQFTPAYRRRMLDWAQRAKAIKRNVGVVDGLALHYWHGPKAKRGYKTRDQVLVDARYDPDKHVMCDAQGLYQLRDDAPCAIELRDWLRGYFSQRDEDA